MASSHLAVLLFAVVLLLSAHADAYLFRRSAGGVASASVRGHFHPHAQSLTAAHALFSRQACTTEYAPVCCITPETGFETKSNACNCRADGGTVSYPMPCHSCICPAVEAPVCCRGAGVDFTAGNSCHCTCAGGVVQHDGPCVPILPGPECVACPANFDPVCCGKGADTFQTSNACNCKCGGGAVLKDGACKPPVLPGPECVACPANYDPVCCGKGADTFQTSNACVCKCGGGAVLKDGACQ